MKYLLALLLHLLTTIAKLLGPGGAKAIVADSLLMKQQLLIINRSRQRAPNLSALDRYLIGFWSQFLNTRHLRRAAVIIRPSTLLKFHNLLKQRKYRLLYSSAGSKRKPGPKGPSQELIQAIVERLIGTIRREFLDHTLFWNATDLERKLETFRQYYNTHRVHSSLDGDTPSEITSETVIRRADLNNFQWQSHCRELFHLPAAV